MFEFQLQKIIICFSWQRDGETQTYETAKLMTHVRPLDRILPLPWQHGGHILRKDTWKELPLHKQPNDNYC